MNSKNNQYPLNSGLLAALRPRQWLKNLIVFGPALFAFNITTESFLGGLIAFILFSAVSSGFYLLNDIFELKKERLHPTKFKGTLAAGTVKDQAATNIALILIVSSLLLGAWRSPYLGLSIFGYGVIQLVYNIKLKQIVILDIMAISSTWVLRAIAGGAAINISLSPWLLLCTAMLGLFLGVGKSKAEFKLQQTQANTPAALKIYSLPLLEKMENFSTTGLIFSYALWSIDGSFQSSYTSWMFITLAFVIYGVFRYHFLSDLNPTQLPEDILLTDRPIVLTFIGWLLTVFIILYFKSRGMSS